jgi:hypothetical protein
MKIIKRVSSEWDIHSPTVTVYGNLVVVGETTQVGSINTLIYDNFVTLAAGQGGGPNLNAGIEVDRGSTLPRVGLRWYEPLESWQYTNDGTLWNSFSGMRLIEDPDPNLGGNLIVNDFTITSDPEKDVVITVGDGGNLKIGPVIRIPQITDDPAPLADHSTIYAKEPSSGSTGLYVTNDKVEAQELVTNRKALLYSLIF